MLYSTIHTEATMIKQAAGAGKLIAGLLGGVGLAGAGKYTYDKAPGLYQKAKDRYFPDPTDAEQYEAGLPDLERARVAYNKEVDKQNKHIAALDPKLREQYYAAHGVPDEIARIEELRKKYAEYARVLKANGLEPDIQQWMRLNKTDLDPTAPMLTEEQVAQRLGVTPYQSRKLQTIDAAGTMGERAIQQQTPANPAPIGKGSKSQASAPAPIGGGDPLTTMDLLPTIGALGGAGIGALMGGDEEDEYGRRRKGTSRWLTGALGGTLGYAAGKLGQHYLG